MTAWLKDVHGYGTHAARPAAGSEGALYYETDTDTLFRDNGSTWNALALGTVSPLTTKGDLWVFSSADTRLAVGADGQVLTADSTVARGVKWATPSGGGGGGGELGYAQITSSFNTSSSSFVDITGLTLTFTAPSGPFIVRIYSPQCDDTTPRVNVALYDVTGGAVVETAYMSPNATNGQPCALTARLNPGAGARTYKAQLRALGGGNARFFAAATEPAYIHAVAC